MSKAMRSSIYECMWGSCGAKSKRIPFDRFLSRRSSASDIASRLVVRSRSRTVAGVTAAAGVIGAILTLGAALAYANLLSIWYVDAAYALLVLAGFVAAAITMRHQKLLTVVEQRAEEFQPTASSPDVSRKDSLLASLSHDLRTPLTTIKGIAHEIVHG